MLIDLLKDILKFIIIILVSIIPSIVFYLTIYKNELYIKQNLTKSADNKHYTGSPIVISSSNNPFTDYMNKFIEWVNNF